MIPTASLNAFAARLREFIVSSVSQPELGPLAQRNHSRFQALALELFALQYARNRPYRRFCAARGVSPDNVRAWERIPAVPAAAFKELELSALPPAKRTLVFHSSGTTEQRPSRHFHSPDSLSIYEASLWPWFAAHVTPELKLSEDCFAGQGAVESSMYVYSVAHDSLGTPRILAALTPSPAAVPHSSLVHMFGVVKARVAWETSIFLGKVSADGGWTLEMETAVERLQEAVQSRRPIALLGTAFSFVHLLDHLVRRGHRFRLPMGSRALETGGYKGRARGLSKIELHALIQERLGIPGTHIVCEYGMSELSSQAYDQVCGTRPTTTKQGVRQDSRPVTRRFRFPLWARVQIISPETGQEVTDGETGLIRVTDLANVYSVMAVQTEDLGIRRGDGFELIGRAKLAEPRGCSLMTS